MTICRKASDYDVEALVWLLLPSLVQWIRGRGGSLVTSHEKNAAFPSTTRWSFGRFTNWGAPTHSQQQQFRYWQVSPACTQQHIQESRAAARKPRDAASVLFRWRSPTTFTSKQASLFCRTVKITARQATRRPEGHQCWSPSNTWK